MNYTSFNYFGKKVDMSIYPIKIEDNLQTLGFGNGSALIISGPLKAAQNYARILLSRKGEHIDDPLFGTSLLLDLSSGNMLHPMRVSQAFSMANLDAMVYLYKKYTADTPLDEKIKFVTLLEYTSSGPTDISFRAELTMASQDSLTFLLPINY